MKSEDIKKVLHAQPFRPFVINLADGRALPVKHQEFVALAPSGRHMIVYGKGSDYHVVDLIMVTSLAAVEAGKTK